MTATFVSLLAATSPALAQLSQSGPAAQFYEQDTNFSFDLPSTTEGGPVKWTADSQEFVQDDYVILDGNVRVEHGDIVIQAGTLTYNFKTKDVTAAGNVTLDQPLGRLTAQRIVFNLDSRIGTLFNATGAFEGSMYFSGSTVEKIDDDTYRLVDGVLTSCDLGDPSWSFHLASGLITIEDYARLNRISFRARKVPVLWLPYLVWPTKSDRARGFLIPKPGYSDRYGSFLRTSYYIPIGDSLDAKLRADLFAKELFGTGADIRYNPDEAIEGTLNTYAVLQTQTNDWEWKYKYRHTQEDLPGGFRGVIDIQDFSNLGFFQQFERDFDLNTISNIYSAAYLTKNTSRFSLNIRADRREHFLGTKESIFEQLPSVQFSMYPNRINGTPLYFSLESSASYLRSTNAGDYLRTDLFPAISMQVTTPAWFSIKPEVSFRRTDYSKSLDPLTAQVADESLSRSYGQAKLDIVGPSFSRIFNRRIGNFSKFKHVIEPRITYLYTTDADGQNRVIRFDTVDSPILPIVSQLVEYSLVQRIMAKEDSEHATAREIMSLELKQQLSLSGPFSTTVESDGTVVEHTLTPLVMTMRINPYRTFRVTASTQISNVTDRFERANVAANISGRSTYLNLNWFARFKPPGATTGDSSQIRVSTGAPIWKDRFRADVQFNYDIERDNLLEQRYLLGFHASCYNIAIEVRDFQDFSRPDRGRTQDYLIALNLKNVGNFLDFRGSFDSIFN